MKQVFFMKQVLFQHLKLYKFSHIRITHKTNAYLQKKKELDLYNLSQIAMLCLVQSSYGRYYKRLLKFVT